MTTINELNIALVQCDLVWEQPEENRKHLDELLRELSGEIDLVVFPEMFATGFSMKVDQHAETMKGPTVRWMMQLAGKKQATIAGSLMIRENGFFFNRFVFAHPDGNVDYYDKRHLFSMGEENVHFRAGEARKVVQIKSFRILPQVCYDLRFPVFSRNRQDYDLLINSANWPAPRREVWEILLRARAIENQTYVAGINRIGKDANGINYAGDTCFVDPKGKLISIASEKTEQILIAKLSKDSLDRFRSKFPALPDADDFSLG